MDFLKKLFNKISGKKANNNNNNRVIASQNISKTTADKNLQEITKLIDEESKSVKLLQKIAKTAGFEYKPNGYRINDYLLPIAKFIGINCNRYDITNFCSSKKKPKNDKEILIKKINDIISQIYEDFNIETPGSTLKKWIDWGKKNNGLPPIIVIETKYEEIQKLLNGISDDGKSGTVELLQKIAKTAGFEYNPNGDRVDDYLLPIARFIGFPNEKRNKKYIKNNLCKELTKYAIKNLNKEEKLIHKIRNIIVECYNNERYKAEGFIGSIKKKFNATGNGLPPTIETANYNKNSAEQNYKDINNLLEKSNNKNVELLIKIAKTAGFEYNPNEDRIDYLLKIAQKIGMKQENCNKKHIEHIEEICLELIKTDEQLDKHDDLIKKIISIIKECFRDKRYKKTEGFFLGSFISLKNRINGLPPIITEKMKTYNLTEALQKLNPESSDVYQVIRDLENIASIVELKYNNKTSRFDLETTIAQKLGLEINNKEDLEKFKSAQNNEHAYFLRKIDMAIAKVFNMEGQNFEDGKLPQDLERVLERLAPTKESEEQIIEDLKNITDIVELKYESTNRFDLEIKIAQKLGLEIKNKKDLEKFKNKTDNHRVFLLNKVDNAVKKVFDNRYNNGENSEKNFKEGKLP